MATLQAIRAQVAREFGYYLSGTSDTGSGSTTTLRDGDTETTSSRLTSSFFTDKWALLTSGTDSGQERRIASWATGVHTVERAWSGSTVAQNVTFEIHTLRPSYINQKINDALRKIYVTRYAFISLVPTDRDQLTSGVTNWTATTATLTKSTAVNSAIYGHQALNVANTGANGQAASNTFECFPGENYLIGAFGRPTNNGTPSFRLHDASGTLIGNAISAAASSIGHAYSWFSGIRTMTSGAPGRYAQVILRATGASDEAQWGPVVVLQRNLRRYYLPAWVTQRAQVQSVVWLNNYGIGLASEIWQAGFIPRDTIQGCVIEHDPTATRQIWITLPNEGWSEWRIPVAVARVPLSAVQPLSADTDDVDLDLDQIKAKTLCEIYKDLMQQRPSEKDRWGPEFSKWASIADGWDDDMSDDPSTGLVAPMRY